MAQLLTPTALRDISSSIEQREINEGLAAQAKRDKSIADMHKAFMARELDPKVFERVNDAVRIAAKRGLSKIEALRFPCSYCNDKGRRINIGDPDWPKTLEGFAKRAYEFYERELKPLGYKVHAEIVTFPGGIPGEAALFLTW